MAHIHYDLGETVRFPSNVKGQLAWRDTNSIEGVIIYARNEKTGMYTRVYEVGADIYVDGEPQSWSRGNFENLADARKFASKAYRFINRKK